MFGRGVNLNKLKSSETEYNLIFKRKYYDLFNKFKIIDIQVQLSSQ